jgi:murein DD-endopeptidase MepM/ murein hydrolase activator NlpD
MKVQRYLKRSILVIAAALFSLALVISVEAIRGKRNKKTSSYKSIGRLQAGLKSVIRAKRAAQRKLSALRDDSPSREEEQALLEKIRTCKRDEKHIRAEIGVVRSLNAFNKPVPGRITSSFGNRFHPILKTYRDHNGIDLAGSFGSRVEAAWSGQVIVAGYEKGYGNTVIIEHPGGRTSLYGHLSQISVEVGQDIRAGQKIGEVGQSGLSTGPHLHFEVRMDGNPVNPSRFW